MLSDYQLSAQYTLSTISKPDLMHGAPSPEEWLAVEEHWRQALDYLFI